MQYRTPMRYALSMAIAAALAPSLAAAQDASTPSDPTVTGASAQADAGELDTIVVSGTAKFKGLRKRDASFSISTASDDEIREASPTSTADLLKIVPGVWAESSGGGTGANVFVRGMPSEGDAPFFTLQLDGSPIYPPPTLSFLENTTLFRIDDTVERVEGLRGGPSPIFSNGQPGVTVNFIQRKGGDTPAGSVRATLGSDALRRVDAFSSGPLGEGSGWYYSVGGFYRETDGVRHIGYPAEKGGQIVGTLTRRWDSGEFTLYGRHTNDHNAFYTAIPLRSRNNGSDISSFPGIDATTGTLVGDDFRRVTLPTGVGGGTMSRDMADGRGVDISVFGGALDWNVGDWTISDRFNVLSGDAPTNALFTGANPQTLSSFIADQYGATAAGTGTFVNGGGAVAPDQQVLTAGWWVVDKRLRSFTNDLRFSIDLGARNALTFGTYYAKYSSKDRWWLGNNMLLTAENNARRIDLALADGRIPTRQGFVGTSFYNIRGDYDGRNTALFIADEWNATDRWRFDAGVRWERQVVDGTVVDPVSVDLDGNPNTLYDNSTSVATTPRSIDQRDTHTSWTAGANFRINDNLSVFGRVNSGFKFPSFDNLRDGATQTQEIDQYEIGLKAGGQSYELYLTAFYNDFVGLPFQAFDQGGNNIVVIGDSSAKGLEFEGAWRPLGGFELGWNTTWLDANYGRFGNFSGNQVVRQPRFRARLTPSYFWTLPWGDAKVFATVTRVGDRYSDPANGQVLPAYTTWDLGANLRVGEHWEFALNGRNVTDEIALTEGNARVIGNATSAGVFMGRPIEGASYQVSAAYRW
ncbi:MAG: TonB-dependent receptor [Xanthomonadales bacterium]|nr:TonB-dependent receptor [Xanthomonadales bacterium]